MKPIIILPEVELEIENSVQYYQKQNSGLELLLIKEIEAGFEKIEKNPERFPQIKKNIRKYLIHRFPFNIIYEIYQDEIVILAIAHQKRNPDYWKTRIYNKRSH